jgi:hypothetical protein
VVTILPSMIARKEIFLPPGFDVDGWMRKMCRLGEHGDETSIQIARYRNTIKCVYI